jgi:hypothetical protein
VYATLHDQRQQSHQRRSALRRLHKNAHVWVIKDEYHIEALVWPVPAIIGAALVLASLWVDYVFLSAALGIFGFTVLWGAHELVKQEKRVERGWFPRNPRKRPRS